MKRTPLFNEHIKLGARMVEFAGYQMPIQYEGISQEHHAVRKAVGIFDVSHMAEMELRGDKAAATIDYLVTSDTTKLHDGQAMYTCACNEQGMVLDDFLVYRFHQDRWMIVCNAANHEKIARHVAELAEGRCIFEDTSGDIGLLAVQGPEAIALSESLQRLGPKIGQLRAFEFGNFELGGITCMACRSGYTGEDGVELFCKVDEVCEMWRMLLAEGAGLGVKPTGLGCRDTLRLEARLALYGNELDETVNPLEAGIGWVVKLDAGDFIGRDALRAIKEKGLSRKSVGFEMLGRGIARHGYILVDTEHNPVGVCTSGGPSPTLGKNIGLGFLPKEMTKIGTKFMVDCRGKKIEAVVVNTPFYKRKA